MRARFVLDASPLIHLAKAGLSSLIGRMDGEKFTVPAVFDEVVRRGKELGYADAVVIESLIDGGVVKVVAPAKRMVKARGLHGGEVEVISLAKEMGAVAILDDGVARAVARLYGVRMEGTYGIILRAVVNGYVSGIEAEDALGMLVSSGWRCDVELYSKLLKLTRDIGSRGRG